MSKIVDTFRKLKANNEAALIGYITAGDPEPNLTPLIAEELIKGGIDILELGLPFSDPIADGPTIQAASVRALNAKTTPKQVLEIAKTIRKAHRDIPVLIMTYFNPIFRIGLNVFFRLAKDCMVDGIIVPDLPVEEAEEYKQAALSYGIDTVFLAAPSTSAIRLQKIVDFSSGFLYLVSHFGVTGARTSVEKSTIQLIKRVLPYTRTRVPLAVGFGVSKPEHVHSIIRAGADGVIVGSAFINIVEKNQAKPEKMLKELCKLTRNLKNATLNVGCQEKQTGNIL